MATITRREFFSTGAKWIALASVPSVFNFDPARLLAGPVGSGTAEEYMALFGVDEASLR